MDTLFAPWRMEFIEKPVDQKVCVLCEIGKSSETDELHILEKGSLAYVVMNKYPYSNGHLMVIPFRHTSDWTSLTASELAEISALTQKSMRALTAALSPHGFNIGVNLGRAAGAGIEAHVHQHLVPRWNGDFNFMPLLAETKVISEHLDQTFRRLKKVWGDL